jgi:hypothetical protein
LNKTDGHDIAALRRVPDVGKPVDPINGLIRTGRQHADAVHTDVNQQQFEHHHAYHHPDRRAQQRQFQVAPEYHAAHPRTGIWIVDRGFNGIVAGINGPAEAGYNCS